MNSRSPNPREPGASRLISELCMVFASEIRLEVLAQLASSEQSVTELIETLQVDQPTVSHALRKLKDYGLVTDRREGQRHYYRLTESTHATHHKAGFTIEIVHKHTKVELSVSHQ